MLSAARHLITRQQWRAIFAKAAQRVARYGRVAAIVGVAKEKFTGISSGLGEAVRPNFEGGKRVVGFTQHFEANEPWRTQDVLVGKLKKLLHDVLRRKFAKEAIPGDPTAPWWKLHKRASPLDVERPLESMADDAQKAAYQFGKTAINKASRPIAKAIRSAAFGSPLSDTQAEVMRHFRISADSVRRAAGQWRGVVPPMESAISRITIDDRARRALKRAVVNRIRSRRLELARTFQVARRNYRKSSL